MALTLITGAAGFIGRALSERLEADNYSIIRAVRQNTASYDFVTGDIGSKTEWKEALLDCKAVVHLAARVHVMHDTLSDPLTEFRTVNTDGTLNLARQAVNARIQRFIYLSSVKVNGEQTLPGKQFTELDKAAPQDAYAISKWEAEQGLLKIAQKSRMEVVIIRPPLVYGHGVKANFLTMMRWLNKGIPCH